MNNVKREMMSALTDPPALYFGAASVSGYGIWGEVRDVAHMVEPGGCPAKASVAIQMGVWSLAKIRRETE
jgi:hypothetical protein